MKTAASRSLQLRPGMMTVRQRQQNKSKNSTCSLPGLLTHARCATASLAAELMAVLKEELISLHRPGDLKLLPRASDDAQIQISWIHVQRHKKIAQNKQYFRLCSVLSAFPCRAIFTCNNPGFREFDWPKVQGIEVYYHL